MTTWAQVQMFINFHSLPYSILRFDRLRGIMIDAFTGAQVAATVSEAERYLRG